MKRAKKLKAVDLSHYDGVEIQSAVKKLADFEAEELEKAVAKDIEKEARKKAK